MSQSVLAFNDKGTSEFIRRIDLIRKGEKVDMDDGFIVDPKFSERVRPISRIGRPLLGTKREAGQYLNAKIGRILSKLGPSQPGLWNWLSAWLWDSLCPPGKRPRSTPYYVYGHGHNSRRGQHLLAVSTLLFQKFPDCRVLLNGPVDSLTAVVQEVNTRLSLVRIPCLGELLDRLYWDEARQRPKAGLVNPGPTPRAGELRRRLPVCIQQLEMTYDLQALSADQLLELLGPEFKQWENR